MRARTIFLAGLAALGILAAPLGVQAGDTPISSTEAVAWVQLIQAMESNPTAETTLNRAISYLNFYPSSSNRPASEYMIGEINFLRGRYELAIPYYRMVAARKTDVGFGDSALFRLGECSFNLGKIEEAQATWNEMLSRYPSSHLRPEVESNACEVYMKLGQYEEAVKGYNSLLSHYPFYRERHNVVVGLAQLDFIHQQYNEVLRRLAKLSTPEAFYWKGRALFAQDRFQDAANYFDKIVKFHGQHFYAVNAAYMKAESFFQGGNLDGATQAYSEFVSRYPQIPMAFFARYKLAAVLLAQKKYQQSLANVSQLTGTNRFPNSAVLAKYLMAEIFVGLGQYPNAAQLFREISVSNPPEEILETCLLKYSWVLYKNRQYDLAAKAAERYLQDFSGSPNAISAYFIVANGLFLTGRYTDAETHYLDILSRFKYSPLLEVALVQLEITYAKLKQMNQIISQAGGLVRATEAHFKPINRNNRAYALYLLGEAYYHEKKSRDAIGIFQELTIKYWDTPAYTYAKESLVWALFEQNDYALVLQEAEKIIKDRQIDPAVRNSIVLLKGHALFNLKRYKDALECYNEWLQKNPKEPSRLYIQYLMGLGFYRLKFYKNAMDIWEKVIAQPVRNEYSRNALLKVSDAFFRGGDYPRARSHYQLFIQRYAGDTSVPLANLRISQSLYNEGNDNAAIASYKYFLQHFPQDENATAAREGIETTAFRLVKKQPQMQNLQAFLTSYPKSKFADQIQYQVADILYKQKSYAEAIPQFNKLILNYPGSEATANSMFYLGDCFDQLKQYADAVSSYKLFAETFPKHDLMPEILTRLAADHFLMNNFEEAINVYRKILEKFPVKPYHEDALYNLAVCYEKLKKQSEAMAMYMDFTQRYPNNPKVGECLIQIGIYYQKQQLWDLAVNTFKKALTSKVNSRAELFFRIGDCYENSENFPLATQAYQSVLPLNPKSDIFRITAMSQLAAIYERAKQWPRAAQLYRDIAKNAPKPEWRQAASERLKQLSQ
jgi:TolA-binding protein